jgi:hypothetical protein
MIAAWLNTNSKRPLAKVLGEALMAASVMRTSAWQLPGVYEQMRRFNRFLGKQRFRAKAITLLNPNRLSLTYWSGTMDGRILLQVLQLSENGALLKLKRCAHCQLWFFGKGKFHQTSCRQMWYRTHHGREKYNEYMRRYRQSPAKKAERKRI